MIHAADRPGVFATVAHRKVSGEVMTASFDVETGDIEEALNAASAIGDDRLQRKSGGTVLPDSFTHGSSAQRVRWFKRGLENGDLRSCDTFVTDKI
jgi:predicted metalloprotease